MLPKTRRLTTKAVTEVLRVGRSKRGVFLSMKFADAPSPFQSSAVVSKSVAKRAVDRNRLRRAVYRAIAKRLQTSPLPSRGRALIFVQKVPSADTSKVFENDLAALFTNLQ